MATDVEIATRAMRLLGASKVTAFDDGTPEGDLAGEFFETTLRSLLSMHRWNFARKTAKLVEDVPAGETSPGPYTNPIIEGWGYAYDRPSDLLTIDRLHKDGATVDAWIEQDQWLATGTSPDVWIDYTWRPVTADLPDWFLPPLEHYLAARLALPVTQRVTLAEAHMRTYRVLVREARHVDSRQSTVEHMPVGRILSVRG